MGGVRVPRNTLVVGAARVQGERLGVEITSLEYRGSIIPVELSVFDSDGQEGIFIPNSLEVSAVKEIAANMGSSLGSSINISTDAGGAARLRPRKRCHTGNEPVHRPEDAHRKGAFEGRI